MADNEEPDHPGEVNTPEREDEEQFEEIQNNEDDEEVILNPRQIEPPEARRALFRGNDNDTGEARAPVGAMGGAAGGAPHPWIRLAPDT